MTEFDRFLQLLPAAFQHRIALRPDPVRRMMLCGFCEYAIENGGNPLK
tara:strand:+ start:357 stop:500 length:144 start_codon:yes stop_codon:yes gene_type:complete